MQWHLLSEETTEQLKNLIQQQTAKIQFEGRDICVVKLEDGIFGVNNRCPHASASLHHGHCNKKGVISCPLHGYKFDIRTGRSADENNYKLLRFQFKKEQESWFISAI